MKKGRPVFVGLSGASKAGKTTTTASVVRKLCGYNKLTFRSCGITNHYGDKVSVGVMCCDDFHHASLPRDRWDDPDALDHKRIFDTVKKALAGEKVDYLIYEGFKAMTL